MKKYLRKISWLQHILTWALLIMFVLLFFILKGPSLNSGKELLEQLVPNLVASLCALIVGYYILLKLGSSDNEEMKEFIMKEFETKTNELQNKIDGINNLINTTNKDMYNILLSLSNRVTSVAWASDLEEHDTNVYNKMSDLLDDPTVTGMDVLSIFHPSTTPKEKVKVAISGYYKKIERAIEGRKLRYRRVIVARKPLGKKKTNESLLSIISNRVEFINHCNNLRKYSKELAMLKFVYTEGRVLDVAFALFYQGNVQDKNVRTLVIEITVWSSEKSNHIMGLLSIERPNSELIKAFSDAFNGVIDGQLDIELLDMENVISR